jgi:hypothetical protein
VVRERPAEFGPFGDPAAIDRAVARGVREALLRHKRLGQSVVAWRDGRVVEIPPERIPVDERES